MLGAHSEAMRQLVLAGFPTTSTCQLPRSVSAPETRKSERWTRRSEERVGWRRGGVEERRSEWVGREEGEG
eukprot:242894-Rhodomonas_salina.1